MESFFIFYPVKYHLNCPFCQSKVKIYDKYNCIEIIKNESPFIILNLLANFLRFDLIFSSLYYFSLLFLVQKLVF